MRRTGCPARSSSRTSGLAAPSGVVDNDTKSAIGAVLVGRTRRLADDRQDASAVLSCALGDELFDPRTERREILREKQRQLVPALGRLLRHERAKDQARIDFRRRS